MRSTLLALLFLTTGVFAKQPPPPSDGAAERVQSLYRETIPMVRLREVSLQEALDEVRAEWEKSHPKEMFPVAITDYRPASAVPLDRVERITVDLFNVPYIEALQQLATLSGRELKTGGGIVRFEYLDLGIVEDYETREYPVSAEVIAALSLKPDSDPAAIRKAFEHYGLEFDQYMKFLYIPARQKLVVMCFRAQHEQIVGVLFLLGKGFHISK